MAPEESKNPLVPSSRSYFSPTAWKAMSEMANVFIKSNALPKHITNAHVLMVILQAGRELGMQPMESITNLYITNGKVALQGTAMLKLIYQSGIQLEFNEESDDGCKVTFSGLGRKPYLSSFTKQDAIKAGLWGKGGPWSNYPKTMMRWRAVSQGARMFCPDILMGAYLPEEAEAINVEPAKPGEVNRALAGDVKQATVVPPAPSPTNAPAQAPRPATAPLNDAGGLPVPTK